MSPLSKSHLETWISRETKERRTHSCSHQHLQFIHSFVRSFVRSFLWISIMTFCSITPRSLMVDPKIISLILHKAVALPSYLQYRYIFDSSYTCNAIFLIDRTLIFPLIYKSCSPHIHTYTHHMETL